jgi:hypothetical protein
MVDILRFVPTDTPIDVMVQIQLTDVPAVRSCNPPDSCGVTDSFTGVPCNRAVFGKIDFSETAEATERRLPD